jgi:hypothetical protein
VRPCRLAHPRLRVGPTPPRLCRRRLTSCSSQAACGLAHVATFSAGCGPTAPRVESKDGCPHIKAGRPARRPQTCKRSLAEHCDGAANGAFEG